jgi:hypothetical protein
MHLAAQFVHLAAQFVHLAVQSTLHVAHLSAQCTSQSVYFLAACDVE